MTVRVLFFSTLRTITDREWLEKDYTSPITVAELLDDLYEEFPPLKDWNERLLIAVDLAYASRETSLGDGQEVALMPPVQGG